MNAQVQSKPTPTEKQPSIPLDQSERFRLAHLRFCQLCRAAYARHEAESGKVA